MKTYPTKYFSIVILLGLLSASSFANALMADLSMAHQHELELAGKSIRPDFPPLNFEPMTSASAEITKSNLQSKYSYVDPNKVIRQELLLKALEIYDKNSSTFPNRDFLTVIDFSKNSQWSRFYLIDMRTGDVESLHTAHGEGSDPNDDGLAERFSNISGSKQSSLGIYRTAETYEGSFGYSLRLDGLSKTNSNVRKRAIVVHGWSKMSDQNEKQILSWGCPAISEANRDRVINLIKGGSLIFADQ